MNMNMNNNGEVKAIKLLNEAETLIDIVNALNAKNDSKPYDEMSDKMWDAFHDAVARIGASETVGIEYWAMKRKHNSNYVEYIGFGNNRFYIVKRHINEVPYEHLI